jgi:hypothetical protein
MTNRREFLQATAISGLPVITGLPVVAGAAEFAGAPRVNPPLNLHSVLVDKRHSEARSVGVRLATAGATVHAVPDGDITQVWLSHIGPAWRHRPVAVAGLTARPALFCLEQLALASGLRVVFHAEHVMHPGGKTEHSILRGAQAAHLSARDLMRAGPNWPARVADAIATHSRQTGGVRPGRSNSALDPTLPPGAQLLTSWVIAAT